MPVETVRPLNTSEAVPATGGLLMMTSFDFDRTDPPKRGEWSLVVDGTATTAKAVVLAPGLEVFVLPAKAKSAELREGSLSRGTVTRSIPTITALAAPKVTTITATKTVGRRATTTQVAVTTSDVPTDAVAMIIADAKTGKARSFGRVEGMTTIYVYNQGRCSALPNGTVETRTGDSVVVRWVDKFGRLSAASKAIKVSKGKTP